MSAHRPQGYDLLIANFCGGPLRDSAAEAVGQQQAAEK